MRLTTVVTELRSRAQNLGLIDLHTGFTDESEIKFYLIETLRDLVTEYQLDLFVMMNRDLVHTADGVESYTIPESLWGWWSPDDDRTSGLSIAESDGTDPVNLRYRDPARYHLERTTSESKPNMFTVSNNMLFFSPVPDAEYVVQGVHRTVLSETDEIPNGYVQAVKAQTLWKMGTDKGKLTNEIVNERNRLMSRLVNNEARTHQKFRRTYDQWYGRGRSHRRYGSGGW